MDNNFKELSTEKLIQLLDELIVDSMADEAIRSADIFSQMKMKSVPILQEINYRNAQKAQEAGERPTVLTWDIRTRYIVSLRK